MVTYKVNNNLVKRYIFFFLPNVEKKKKNIYFGIFDLRRDKNAVPRRPGQRARGRHRTRHEGYFPAVPAISNKNTPFTLKQQNE